jgi:hypothetical protein
MTVGEIGKVSITLGGGPFTSSLQVFDYPTGPWLETQSLIEDGTGDLAVDDNHYIMGSRRISICRPNW